SMLGAKGKVDVVQGITQITPVWCKVEALQTNGITPFMWDMHLATTSIPRETLSEIIKQQIDPKNLDDRLKVVRLYLQGERYQDAEAELKQISLEFPNRKQDLETVAHDLRQLGARQLLDEIETRRKAGQHQFASALLNHFPSEGVDGQILQQA